MHYKGINRIRARSHEVEMMFFKTIEEPISVIQQESRKSDPTTVEMICSTEMDWPNLITCGSLSPSANIRTL